MEDILRIAGNLRDAAELNVSVLSTWLGRASERSVVDDDLVVWHGDSSTFFDFAELEYRARGRTIFVAIQFSLDHRIDLRLFSEAIFPGRKADAVYPPDPRNPDPKFTFQFDMPGREFRLSARSTDLMYLTTIVCFFEVAAAP